MERPPDKIDFSQGSIKKQVTEYIISHPFAWYPLTFGIVGLMAVFLNIFGGVLLYIAIGLCGVGIIGWLVKFLQRESAESRIINQLTEQLEKQKISVVNRLRSKLNEFNKIESLKLYSEQAETQFGKVKKKFESFKEMLGEKLNPTSLAYGRFFGTVEQVYLVVLDRLEAVVRSLETMNSIDPEYVEKRMNHLNSLGNPENADIREVETLKTRLELRETNRIKANELLTENEVDMTRIDQTMSEIADARTIEGRATVDMEFAREELVKLTERIKDISVGGKS